MEAVPKRPTPVILLNDTELSHEECDLQVRLKALGETQSTAFRDQLYSEQRRLLRLHRTIARDLNVAMAAHARAKDAFDKALQDWHDVTRMLHPTLDPRFGPAGKAKREALSEVNQAAKAIRQLVTQKEGVESTAATYSTMQQWSGRLAEVKFEIQRREAARVRERKDAGLKAEPVKEWKPFHSYMEDDWEFAC